MDWVKGLQRTIDYIESHITEPADYDRIAREMNVSAFYFQRIFTMICGFTPGEYIRNRRLALAAGELLSTDAKIIDIAMKYGYDTPEGFSRAFSRFHGTTPNAVRRERMSVRSFSPLQVSISLKGGKSMNYRIIEKEAFRVIEKACEHSMDDEQNQKTIPEFWDISRTDGTRDFLLSCLDEDEKNLYGICYDNSTTDSQTFEYSIAAKCSRNVQLPEGYRFSDIPAQTWAVFECVGAMPDAIQNTWRRILTEFFPASDYEPAYNMDIEVYDRGDISAENYKSWIWVSVKKK